jgi:small subunit ribosomal protein S13
MTEQKQEQKENFKPNLKPAFAGAPKPAFSSAHKADDNFKHFIRIANTDLNGDHSIERALKQINGISFQFARAVCTVLRINGLQKVGYMDEKTVQRIESLLKDPVKAGIPHWMFNRRKDVETGQDMHILTTDLDFIQSNDIKMMKKIKCYKGVRHMHGQPVRGQRTKSHFRKNKGKGLGVKKNPNAKSGKT